MIKQSSEIDSAEWLVGTPRNSVACPFLLLSVTLPRKVLVKTSLDCSMHSRSHLCHDSTLAMYPVAERSWLTSAKKSPFSPGYWAATPQCKLPTEHWHETKRPPHFVLSQEIQPHNSSSDLLICILLVLLLSSHWWISQAILSEVSLYLFFSHYIRWMIRSVPKGFAFTTVHHPLETIRQ